jgi:proteasome lid subunit RPN8/RPN11
VAGLRYFQIIKEKLRERGAAYKVLYAFSDFVHPQTNAYISEHAVNELQEGGPIEDRFEGDDYRLMVVANKFQTGFDQPLLAGMCLDKPVVDRNAVQTLSRLNRCHDRKQEHFLAVTINGANEVLNVRVISIGLIDRSPVHPREVFADAVAERASGIIVAHNHPAGGLEPSPADIEATKQLKGAGQIVGIELFDHIIFNRVGYFSFLESGKL